MPSHHPNLPATSLLHFWVCSALIQPSSARKGMPWSRCKCITNYYIPLWYGMGPTSWGLVTNLLWIVVPEFQRHHYFPIFLYIFSGYFISWFSLCVLLSLFLQLLITANLLLSFSVFNTSCRTVSFQVSPYTDLSNTSSIWSLKTAVEEKHNEILLYLYIYALFFVLLQIQKNTVFSYESTTSIRFISLITILIKAVQSFFFFPQMSNIWLIFT